MPCEDQCAASKDKNVSSQNQSSKPQGDIPLNPEGEKGGINEGLVSQGI